MAKDFKSLGIKTLEEKKREDQKKAMSRQTYNKLLASALDETYKYSQQGPEQAQDVTNTLLGGMTNRKPGDLKTWNRNTARWAAIGEAAAVDYFRDRGFFNSESNAYNKETVHLPDANYLKSLSATLGQQYTDSQQKDADMNALRQQTAETSSRWIDLFRNKDDASDIGRWHNLLMADYLLGDRNELFDFEAVDSRYASMSDDEYNQEYKRLTDQWDNLDWETLTGSKANKYQSETATIKSKMGIVDNEISRKQKIADLEALARSNPEFASLSVYNDPGYVEDESYIAGIDSHLDAQRYYTKGLDDLNRFLNTNAAWADKMMAGNYNATVQGYLNNGYDYLTSDELAVYNVLYNTDPAKAAEYLDALRNDLLYRRAQVNRMYGEAIATNPYTAVPAFLGASAGKVLNTVMTPWQMYEAAIGKDSPYSAAYDFANTAGYITDAQSAAIGEISMPDWMTVNGKNILQHLYGAAASGVDNAARIIAAGGNPTVALIFAGLQSGSASLQESAGRNDMSGAAKIVKAIGNAAMEVGTEKIGLDALFDTGKKGALSYIKNVILSEMGEEALNYISEDAIESVVAFLFDHEADIKSGPEFWQGLTDTLIQTALSGGMMGTTGAVTQRIGTSSTGSTLRSRGDIEGVLAIGDSMAAGTDSYTETQAVREKQKAGKKVSNYDLGRVVKAIAKDIGDENSAVVTKVYDEAIEDRLVELGDTVESAKKNAPVIRKMSMGQKLSAMEHASVMWSDNATQVVKELTAEQKADTSVGNAAEAEGQRTGQKWRTEMGNIIREKTADLTGKQLRFTEALTRKTSTSTATSKAAEKAKKLHGKGTDLTAKNMSFGDTSGEFQKVTKKDGKFFVEVTADGGKTTTEAALDDVTSFDGEGLGTVLEYTQEAAHEMTAAEVNTMANAYMETGGDAQSFIANYESAYLSGYSGLEMPSNDLSDGIRAMAYEHGKAEAAVEETKRVTRAAGRRAQKTATTSWLGKVSGDNAIRGTGSVEGLSEALEGMTDSQRFVADFASEFGQQTGINIVLFEGVAGSDGKITTQNGSYDSTTNTIYLDINSGANTSADLKNQKNRGTLGYALMRTLGHEVTHAIEATSTEFYAKYKQAVKDELKAKGLDWSVLVRQKIDAAVADGRKLTFAGAEAEVVADASEYMLQDSKFVKNLDNSIKGKIKTIIRDFMDKVNTVFRNLTGGHIESAALRESVDGVFHYTKNLQELWDAALDEMVGQETTSNDVVDALYETGEIYSYATQNSLRIRDEETIAYLENQQHITTYRAMQVIDGKLYPPMAEFIGSKKDGNREDPGILGHWEMAVEHPELIKWVGGKPKFELKKTNDDGSVSVVPAAYNPYMHSSNTVLNDQFSKAFQRNNLVVVECVVPASESDGAYHAQYAKDSTGWHEWKSGVVAGDIAKQKSGFRRDVFLSRYIKPVRILPDSEVAEKIAGYLDGTNVTVPFHCVWPTLRDALVQVGVKITEPRALGSAQAKIATEAFEEWSAEKELSGISYSRRATAPLTASEYKRVSSAWFDYKNRGYQFKQRKNGGILVDLDSAIVYTDENGTPEYVLDVSTDDRWSNNDVYNLVVEMEEEGKSNEVQRRILKSMFGTEGAHFRTGRKRERVGGQIRKGTGRNARDVGFGNSQEVSEEVTDTLDGIEIDDDTESAYPTQKSIRTWAESDYVTRRNEAAERLAKAIGVSTSKAKKWIDDVNSISAYILDNKARLDYIPTAVAGMSAFKSNPEYGGSIDMSTICAKRRLATGTLDAIQRALGDAVLTKDDFLHIREMMKERGHEVACGLCFVESSRKNLSKYNKQFLDQYKAEHPDSELGMVDLNTVEGLERIRSNPDTADVYAAYEKFMNKLAQRKPKLFEKRTEYNHEILKKFKSDTTVGIKNRNGGLRLQSFSDFEIVHLIDMMQVITDMASVGLAGQAYTKVPDFAWALGDTGLKINLSLIAKDVDADGNLVFDDVEGMNHLEAEKLRNAYSKNVGTIVVTFTDEQTIAAMKSDFIDYIIPFHRSQWQKGDYSKLGLPEGTKDYTIHQNEKEGRKRAKENFLPNAYWDFSVSGKQNAINYLNMCADAGRTPKFAKFLQNNGDGTYSLNPDGSTDGYWKLLIDFKMYDNAGAGSPQLAVQPDFNMDQAMRMLEEYKGEHDSFPVAQDVVDAFVKEYNGDVGGIVKTDGRYTVNPIQKSTRDLPSEITVRDYLAQSDESAAATVEERNALTIYQKLLKGHADASEKVSAAEQTLLTASEADKPEARKALAAARSQQKDIYNRLLNVERTPHVQSVVKRTSQLMGDLSGKTQSDVERMIADRERTIANLKADITGLKGAVKTQREADIRENERQIQQLKSKAAQALLKNSEHYQQQIDEIRMRRDMNLEIGKKTRKIRRIVKALNDRITHEEDYKNVKEPLKPAVFELVRTFVDEFDNFMFYNPSDEAVESGSKSAIEARRKFERLKMVYDKLANIDGEEAFSYDPEVSAWLVELHDLAKQYGELHTVGDTNERLKTKLYILNRLSGIAGSIDFMVKTADSIFVNGRKHHIKNIAYDVAKPLSGKDDRKESAGKIGKAINAFDDVLLKGNMTPVTFFESLNNSGLEELYGDITEAERVSAARVLEGREFISGAMERHGYLTWGNMKKPVSFVTEQGREVYMTTGNMLWAYATAKREASNPLTETHHLSEGGFAYDKVAKNTKEVANSKWKNDHNRLTANDIKTIEGLLTPDQIAFADECVHFLSTVCADWGNEASLEMFGIKKYSEDYYFPFQVDGDQLYKNSAAGSASTTNDSRLKHSPFTHSVNYHANKPLVMGDFLDVVDNHINQMAIYSSFVLPIENLNRVLNSRVDYNDESVTIRSLIARKHGNAAQKYLNDFLKDMNGGPQTDKRGETNGFIRLFKQNAVMGKLSVALQQVSSIARAFAYIKPKYFANIPKELPYTTWERMMKYSGTTVYKDMGGFNIGLGHQAADWIGRGALEEYNYWKRGKFLLNQQGVAAMKDNWIDFLTALPGVMDKVTWAAIWTATENEQADLNRDMKRDSEEFLEKVGKRFDDIIRHSQVYDSVLSKSQNMRSKSGLAKMITSFMAEPTLTMNMVYSAVKSKNVKTMSRTSCALMLNALLGSLAYAAVTAWDKDEDDRTATEKFVTKFAGKMVDNVNPLTMIPFVSDLWSIVNGYDVERTDVAVFADLFKYGTGFFEKLSEGKELTLRDYENFFGTAVVVTTGIPLKNMMGDARRLLLNAPATDWATAPPASRVKYGILDEIIPWRSTSNTAYYERYLAALMDGDKQEQYDLKDYVMSTKGIEEKALKSGVVSVYKDVYLKGGISKTEAAEFLYKNDLVNGSTNDTKRQAAFKKVDEWDEGSEDYSVYNTVFDAAKTGNSAGITKGIKEMTANGYAEKDVISNVRKMIRESYMEGTMSQSQVKAAYKSHFAPESFETDDQNEWYWLFKELDWGKKNKNSTEGYSNYIFLKDGFNTYNESSIRNAWDELTSHGYEDKDVKTYIRTNILKPMVQDGRISPERATELLRKWAPYNSSSDNIDKPKEWLETK